MSKEKIKPAVAPAEKVTFAFGKENYRMMLIGVAIVALGMVLMMSSPSTDPNKMSETIFDFQRLTLAPIVIITGYVVVLLSIIKKPKAAN